MTIFLATYTAEKGLSWFYDKSSIDFSELDKCRRLLGPLPDFDSGEKGYEGIAAVDGRVFLIRCTNAKAWDFRGRDATYITVTWLDRDKIAEVNLDAILSSDGMCRQSHDYKYSFDVPMPDMRTEGGIAHGVVKEDHQHLLDPIRIGDHVRKILLHIQFQLDALLLGVLTVALIHVVDELSQTEGGFFHVFRAGLEPGQLEHVGDEAGKPLHLVEHDAVVAHLDGIVLDHAVRKGFQEPTDGCQRRAQLMGDVGDIVSAHLLQVFDLRHVLEKAHHARAGVVLPHHRHDGDPQVFLSRQGVPKGVGLPRLRDPG